MPSGPGAEVIAPAGAWLEAQAITIAGEAELSGVRSPLASASLSRRAN